MVKAPARRTRRVLKSGPAGAALQSSVVAPAEDPRQPSLFSDPMPDRVEPCLALLSSKVPTGDDWVFEVKWDGYRLAVHIEPGGKVRIITRGGHDWTARFPSIARDALALGLDSAILDGEAVVLSGNGASDFGALQQALGGRGGKRQAAEAMLYAFDLLYLNGHDLRRMGLMDRRALLDDVLDEADGAIRLSREIAFEGADFLREACEMRLEGIIAKRRDAPYRSGRGGDWLKIKCIASETFLIIGYEPSTGALGGIGRLLLAGQGNYGFVFAGSVGTGFTNASATELRRKLDRLRIDKPAVKISRKGVVWVRPKLAAEIAFRGWTHDQKLRHASYKGVREVADEVKIHRME